MNDEEKLSQILPIAKLSGVIENKGEAGSCSLVFALEVEDADDDPAGYIYLSYASMLDALRFAQEQVIIPPLSAHWWARVERTDGCTFQG